MNPPMWMVRPSGRSARPHLFRDDGVIALGVGREFGEVPDYQEPDDLYERLRRSHPQWRAGRHRAAAAQLHCFLREMQPGDHVLTWDAQDRAFYLGTILTEARWDPDATGEMPYVRGVRWSHGLRPDDLSGDCRTALNVIQTLFHIGKGVAQEVIAEAHALHDGVLPESNPEVGPPDEPDEPPTPPPADAQVWLSASTDDRLRQVDVAHTPIPGALKAIRPTPAPAGPAPTAVVVEVEAEEEDIQVDHTQDEGLEPEDDLPYVDMDEALHPVGASPMPGPTPSIAMPKPPAPPATRPAVQVPEPEVHAPRARRSGSGASSLAMAARQRVEERLGDLGTDGLRSVVAGVLQVRGYPRRSVDPETGADLFSGADLLGRDETSVRVHVLDNGKAPVTADQVGAVLADRSSDERWILMAAEGFERAARQLAEELGNKGPRNTLLDAQDLARLVLRHYDDIDLATRALVPMVRVWWPAWEEAP